MTEPGKELKLVSSLIIDALRGISQNEMIRISKCSYFY